MKNNIVCSNCGSNNIGDSIFCSNCGKQLMQNNQANNVDDSKGNILGIISLALYFGGSVLIAFILRILPVTVRDSFSTLSGLCPLSGIIIMIIGRVKYPTNKFLKVVMWIIIGTIIISLVTFIIFVIWCYVTCASVDTSGCS